MATKRTCDRCGAVYREVRGMKELRICFEVSVVDNGEPCTFGMQVSLGETSKTVDYEKLTKAVDVDKLISLACLDSIGVTKDDVKFITPDMYDRLYGEDGDTDVN